MKKILLLSMVGLCAGTLHAQTTLFNQTFTTNAADAAAVTAAYVRNQGTTPQIAIGDNMFTRLGSVNAASLLTSASVTGGKLSLMRTGNFNGLPSVSNDHTLAAARTATGSSGSPNARLVLNSPQVMKVSMDITVGGFAAYASTHNEAGATANVNGMINAVLFFVGGDGLLQYGGDNPSNSVNAHSALAITTSADGNTFRFSRPSGFGNAGTGADLGAVNYAKGSTVTLTWYVNNSGSSMNYTDPEGNAQTLGNDQWDLFVKEGVNPHTLILNDRTAITNGASGNINNMALQVRPLIGYNSNTAGAGSWVANPITVDIANWLVEDVTSIVTLPVKLDRFSGLATTSGNEISWRTGSETNNSHFEILRASDGINFTKIGEVAGKGTTSSFTNYTFLDRNPLPGVNYYMLKQYDFNGDVDDYSPIAVRALERDLQFAILSKENGEVEVFYFSENSNKQANLKIFDLNGKILLDKVFNVEKGYNKVSLSASLPSGLLVGVIKNGQQKSKIKFLK